MATSRVVRQRIWDRLADVARPDTRFHLNFAEVIPDFEGAEAATDRIEALPAYQQSKLAFVTPDNSLVELRRRMIAAGKPFVVSTYNIRRGFRLIEPGSVPKGHERYAAWLDGIEHFGKPVTAGRHQQARPLRFHGDRRLGGVDRRHPFRQGPRFLRP